MSRLDFLHSLICARLLTVRLIWSILTEYLLVLREGASLSPFSSW